MLLNLALRKLDLVNSLVIPKRLAQTFIFRSTTNKNKLISAYNTSTYNPAAAATGRNYSSLRVLTSSPLLGAKRANNILVLTKTTNRNMSTSAVNLKLVKSFDNIVQSNQDKRLYRGLLLDNGLKCLLVSDPLTDRSAAAVDVHAGYMLDPKEFPGLAHFCEHMLFMGSKKYPVENVFSKFIEDHAGSTNAYTSNENTNYHFEVATTHFKEALDIFAQFFISPLFEASSTDRELMAVDSENQKNLQSDAWRIDQLEKSTCRDDHAFSKFGTGNLNTLKVEPEKLGLSVREELLKFHSKYYSANLMTLCLLGKESLDELQQYAVDMFSDIPNQNLPKIDFDKDPFGPDSLTSIKFIQPVQDLRYLSLSWVIPDHRDLYDANPSQYISHLVGHEGDGSLLSELKRKGWCNHLHAGARREARGFQIFNLTVDLSEEGGEKCDEILKLVYQYLNMLRKQKPAEWIYDELNDLGKISFTFKDKEKPISFVSSLAADLHIFSMDHILTANYYLTRYDPALIETLYDYLVPEKMRVSVVSKKYEGKTDRTEKWYGTEYRLDKLNQSQLQELKGCGLNEAFHLPEKNTFIPNDLGLIKHDAASELPKFPRIIHSSPLTRLWFKEDTKFLLPKAVLKFELRNPLAYLDPVHVNMSNLFVELLSDSLTEYSYAAELAGLKYNIKPTNYGLNVGLSGFSDKMNILLETLFERMATFKVDPQRFNILKESYQRNLLNFEAEQPFQHSVYYTTILISEKSWTKQHLLSAINDFTIEDLQSFIPKLLTQGLFIESIVFGNINQQRAVEFLNTVENKLKTSSRKLRPLDRNQLNNFRQVQLPEGSNYVHLKKNTIHKTAGIEVYYQCGPQNTHDNALVELFCQVINEASFNVLRTQEQLGYIVASGVRNFGGAQGVRLIIQSDRSPSYLDERIENFIRLTKDTIDKMTDEEFKLHVEALALTKLEQPKKMSKQCDIYWNEISSHQYHFDRENIEVEELQKLTKDDLKEFFHKFISEDSKQRKKLAVFVYPPEMHDDIIKDQNVVKASLIENFNEWHNGMHLYPLPRPYMKID